MSVTHVLPPSSNTLAAEPRLRARSDSFDAADTTRADQRTSNASRRNNTHARAEFTGLAATAFNNKKRGKPAAEPPAPSRFASALTTVPNTRTAFGHRNATSTQNTSRFDDTASSAFGKKEMRDAGGSVFDAAAASAFGKKHDDTSDLMSEQNAFVFSKKRNNRSKYDHAHSSGPVVPIVKHNTVWAAISSALPEDADRPSREWGGSAIRQQKKASAATKSAAAPSTAVTEENFPSLGGSKPAIGSSAAVKPTSSTTFADIMRARIVAEEEERRQQEAARAKEEEHRRRELRDQTSFHFMRSRFYNSTHGAANYIEEEEEYYDNHNEEDDLDYVHPSELGKHKRRDYNYEEEDIGPEEDQEESEAW